MNKIIEVQNLKKSYQVSKKSKNGSKTFEAVKGISFSVERGEIFGILGPNGAGKTTTLEILECLKHQTEGKVTVLGLDNIKFSEQIKERIGVQLQSSEYFPYLTLKELLDLFSSLYKGKSTTKSSKELLKLVNLEEKENEQVKNLSGGQKQRFTVASSLVNDPEILFLDEPTTGLDPTARKNMWKLVKKLNAQGITIVITTHYMEEAEFLCNRVAILDKGIILKIEEPKKLIEQVSNSIQVSFLIENEQHGDFFKNLLGVKKSYDHFPKIILELDSLDYIPNLLELLKQKEIPFSSFTVKTATLEDVYLHLTGHEFEE